LRDVRLVRFGKRERHDHVPTRLVEDRVRLASVSANERGDHVAWAGAHRICRSHVESPVARSKPLGVAVPGPAEDPRVQTHRPTPAVRDGCAPGGAEQLVERMCGARDPALGRTAQHGSRGVVRRARSHYPTSGMWTNIRTLGATPACLTNLSYY